MQGQIASRQKRMESYLYEAKRDFEEEAVVYRQRFRQQLLDEMNATEKDMETIVKEASATAIVADDGIDVFKSKPKQKPDIYTKIMGDAMMDELGDLLKKCDDPPQDC